MAHSAQSHQPLPLPLTAPDPVAAAPVVRAPGRERWSWALYDFANTIFSMNVFDIAYFMFPPSVFGGQLGPQDSALFYMVYLFQQAFQYFHMGYAAALAWILFAVTMVITLIQLRLSKYFVYSETSR